MSATAAGARIAADMENPAYLLGIPLVVVGVIGALVTLAMLLGSVWLPAGSLAPGQSAPAVPLFGSSIWPFVVVAGGALALVGLVTHVSLLGIGIAVGVLGVLGWLAEDVTRRRGHMHGGAGHQSGPQEERERPDRQDQA